MPNTVQERIQEWAQSGEKSELFYGISQQIEFLADQLFAEYLPTAGPRHLAFRARLQRWLDGAKPDDQRLLFQLIPHIFFVGRNQFESLYRAAFNDNIMRWLIDMERLQLDDKRLNAKLAAAIKETWFCGITDSMPIADFHHVNNIKVKGIGLRPDWVALMTFGAPARITDYCAKHGLKRIVMLEDFVGSGEQMTDALTAWAELDPPIPLLIVPLIACPTGCERGRMAESKSSEIFFSPVLELPEGAFIAPKPSADELSLFQQIRDLVIALKSAVRGGHEKEFSAFGYPPAEPIGGLVVMYSNCPDTTLPLLHFASPSWLPLFPRTSRV